MENSTPNNDALRQKWSPIEIFGLILLLAAGASLIFNPDLISGVFNSIVAQTYSVSVQTFITSDLGIAIVVSVIVGRLLERLGMTDAMIRVFLPVMKWMNLNPTVIVPSIFNILGDINASGAIAGPVLVKANCTKDEQKLAVATMIQNPQSFSTFVLGIVALRAFNIAPLPVILVAIFLPLIIIPLLLSKTIYRDTKAVTLSELPRFTPTDKTIMNTLFDASIEGVKVWLLIIVPAVTVVFGIIGVLDYIGIWTPLQGWLGTLLSYMSIEPETGIYSFLVAPTLSMSLLPNYADTLPRMVVGGFVLANSGLPLSVILGQVPTTWKEYTDLTDKEAMKAALLGLLIRLIYAAIVGYALTPFIC